MQTMGDAGESTLAAAMAAYPASVPRLRAAPEPGMALSSDRRRSDVGHGCSRGTLRPIPQPGIGSMLASMKNGRSFRGVWLVDNG